MKSPFAVFRGRSVLDTLGLMAVMLLFTANAFHFNIYQTHVFYRELFGLFFLTLSLWYLATRTRVLYGGATHMNRVLFYLLLFPVLLVVWSGIDPGVPLYGDYQVEGVTDQLGDAKLSLYVIRNALLYLPMVLYFYLRGLNGQEIRLIALLAILVAPFSLGAYLQSGDIATLATLGLVVELGGGIAYNSYVPYLTFSILCGIFLLFSRISLSLKLIVLLCVAITVIFCIFSTSRQSVLFVVLTLATFLFCAKDSRYRKGNWLSFAAVALAGVVAFSYFTQGYDLNEKFLSKFGSAKGVETSRFDIAFDGILLLNPMEWFVGAGLTSVVNSGPHNDYVRWIQRVGIPLMILGFLPFLISLRVSYRQIRRSRSNNTLIVFLAMAVGFNLFHSIFGYPREDANQAIAVYLGLALWFGALREGLLTSATVATQPQQRLGADSLVDLPSLRLKRPAL